MANAKNPEFWVHFRAPQTKRARDAMENEMVVFNGGFMDQICEDKPSGSWSLQIDSRMKEVTVRSLLWPGYFSFHRLDSNLYGGVYVGDGSKNIDLPFMI